MTLFADLVFPLPLDRSFRYVVPPNLAACVRPGKRARAPFGRKVLAGFIVAVDDRPPDGGLDLKDILDVLDTEPVVSDWTLEFTRRLSARYGSSWGEFLQAHLPPSRELKTSTKVKLTEEGLAAWREGRLSPEETQAAGVLGPKAFTLLHIRRKTGIKNPSSVISRLRKKGLIEVLEKSVPPIKAATAAPAASGPAQLELDFTIAPLLKSALAPAGAALDGRRFVPWLFHGAADARWAGYLALIPKVLSRSRQVLVLVPELASTSPIRDVLERKLGEKAAVLHGGMADGLREAEWRRIRSGEARIVLGPRSALFSPAEDPGLIVVEDESDESYVQSESPAYDARQAAWMSAADRGALIVFGAEAPSVEAYHRAREGGWLVSLPAAVPRKPAELVDDRGERGLVARRVLDRIGENLRAGSPGLIFLNRLGYAAYLQCPRCGTIPRCERCEISLSYSKKEEKLVCRYCGASGPGLTACPECGGRVMEPRGAGVEAVEEALRKAFPEARIASFDSARVRRNRTAREKAVRGWATGKIDILLGTEMLAHQDLPPAAWVAILHPEARLAHPDFRSAQRTFQSLGRMMRYAGQDGDIFIQSAAPEHHAVREAARRDYGAFFDAEIGFRKLMNYPPFSAMAEIILFGRDLRPLGQRARDLVRLFQDSGPGLEVTGPGLAPPSARRGEKGLQLVLKADDPAVLDAGLELGLRSISGRRSVVRFD